MMLLNSFFYVTEQKVEGRDCPAFAVKVDPAHEIYGAHFPGKPITPGVCQIQMVAELLSLYMNAKVELAEIKNVKYMAVISPEETDIFSVTFSKISREDDRCKVGVVFSDGNKVYSKMSLVYHVVCDCSYI